MSEATPPPIVIEAKGVGRVYSDGQVKALADVNCQIRAGDYVAIMGPSGSGKSTLLGLLGALDRPTAGSLEFSGKPYTEFRDLDSLRSQKMGFVFQSFFLLPTLTAAENVQVPMFEGPLKPAQRRQKAEKLLDTVGLSHRVTHLPNQLSIGERQRVAIARSLANDPLVLLADEPTGNLDSQNAAEVLKLFERLHGERQMTLVVITHSDEVARHAERLIMMRDGRVVEDRPISGTANS